MCSVKFKVRESLTSAHTEMTKMKFVLTGSDQGMKELKEKGTDLFSRPLRRFFSVCISNKLKPTQYH